ncbi:GNAT family N-acetyltransferase [Streptomyces sp. NBC_00690]|uniref:GNAT family N-acetyltransferase n=1 Tax=Streptomyces sp. NBC_00690 TaxID=2975808 RepID=UPI002E2A6BAC|nr:GNAT family N-acetyltransferase [Streptomyces sp. NBC_00690]
MTLPTTTTRLATASELEAVAALCTAAFADEAVMAWVLPDPDTRIQQMHSMFGSSLGGAADAGALMLAVADGERIGASIWLPRTGRPQPMELPTGSDPASLRLRAVQKATDTRCPERAHLYLQSMAVLPEHRGRGAGSMMLTYGLAQAKERGLPVYLEASTRDNRTLYARHGFRDHGEPIHLLDDGPSLQPMWLDI